MFFELNVFFFFLIVCGLCEIGLYFYHISFDSLEPLRFSFLVDLTAVRVQIIYKKGVRTHIHQVLPIVQQWLWQRNDITKNEQHFELTPQKEMAKDIVKLLTDLYHWSSCCYCCFQNVVVAAVVGDDYDDTSSLLWVHSFVHLHFLQNAHIHTHSHYSHKKKNYRKRMLAKNPNFST